MLPWPQSWRRSRLVLSTNPKGEPIGSIPWRAKCKNSMQIINHYSCVMFLVYSSCWRSYVKSSCVLVTPLRFFLRKWSYCCRRCDWALGIANRGAFPDSERVCACAVSQYKPCFPWLQSHHRDSRTIIKNHDSNSFYTFSNKPLNHGELLLNFRSLVSPLKDSVLQYSLDLDGNFSGHPASFVVWGTPWLSLPVPKFSTPALFFFFKQLELAVIGVGLAFCNL